MNALKPDTMATLIQMARDIYPHDLIPDENYAIAVKGYDVPAEVDFAESGIAMLNETARAAGHGRYLDVGWERDRIELLRRIEDRAFFERVRGVS